MCNIGGNVFIFLKFFKKWSYIELIKYLVNKVGIDFDYLENIYESDN